MDNEKSLHEYMEMIQKFCEERDWDQYHNPKDLAIGISTEAGELLDLFRFKSLEDIHAMLDSAEKRECIEDELADVFFFVLRFAQMNNIDLWSALQNKIVKNAAKYPTELVRGKNLKYSDYEKR